MARKKSKTTAKAIEAAEKARRALHLRRAGLDFDAIAAEVGYSNRSGAWKAVVSLLERRASESGKDADEVISLELDRLDSMLRALWPKVVKGDVQAIDRVIKIQDRRAKYLGLDAPNKQEVSGPEGGPVQISAPTIFIPAEDNDACGASGGEPGEDAAS